MPRPWLSLIGIGEDGRDGLSSAAKHLLSQAELVVGGARHLALAAPLEAETLAWSSPLADTVPKIIARRGRPTCVLASGDPFWYGIGATLLREIAPDELLCLPGRSAFSLAASALKWPLQDCTPLSLHGRSFERIVPHLQPAARLLVLSWDETTPQRLCAFLTGRRLGKTRVTVLSRLGGPQAAIVSASADEGFAQPIDPLNIVALEIVAERHSLVLPLAGGLDDDWFEHDGQITKRAIRAVTLSALAPRRGDLLWDIGAGSGSVGIEWMLRDPRNRAVAIEATPERAARIARNAGALGVPDLRIVLGRAPAALAALQRPDAVFIGGGASGPGVVEAAWNALPSGGRLVINAVTIETQAALIARFKQKGGGLTTMQMTHADAVGGFFGWRPAMPVTQWAVTKP